MNHMIIWAASAGPSGKDNPQEDLEMVGPSILALSIKASGMFCKYCLKKNHHDVSEEFRNNQRIQSSYPIETCKNVVLGNHDDRNGIIVTPSNSRKSVVLNLNLIFAKHKRPCPKRRFRR